MPMSFKIIPIILIIRIKIHDLNQSKECVYKVSRVVLRLRYIVIYIDIDYLLW